MLCAHTINPVGASEYQVLNKNSVFFCLLHCLLSMTRVELLPEILFFFSFCLLEQVRMWQARL